MHKLKTLSIPFKQKLDKYVGYLLIVLFLPLTRLLGILLRRNHQLNPPPQTILFIKLLGIGSLLVSAPAIRRMRQRYPEAKFILLTDPNIDRAIAPLQLFNETWAVRSDRPLSTCVDAISFLVKSWTFQSLWVVDLEVYSKLTTVYSLMTFAQNRFGFYLTPVFFRKYLNTHNVLFDQSTFLEDNYLHMAEAVTGTKYLLDEELTSTRKNEQLMPFIAINNTCSELALVRKLPDDMVANICEWLLQHTSYQLALLGAPSDRLAIEQFLLHYPKLSAVKDRIINYAGTAGFESYYDFLSRQCAFLITIDSGPLHLAKTLGLPTVSIWGPTDPDNYLKIPLGEEERHLYYYSNVHCSPCIHRHEVLPCGGNNFCMQAMETETILNKIKTMLLYLKLTDRV
ncbi:MAG: glycosyl transferase family 9 [Chitinophagaceae bacterium]|nr:glycosyl transferase family 9 [Chitinophagaceae bacterium]